MINKPLLELSDLLGFDLPAQPSIDLACIRADGAIVHWSLPKKPPQKKEHKYEVQLNGNIIGAVPAYESAITILGLLPGSFNVVRVALVNGHEFSSKSAAIRFVTKPSSSDDYFVTPQDGADTDADASTDAIPRIRPYRALKDITPASPVSAPMAREGSSGLAPRRVSGRRPSPATLGIVEKHDPQPEDSEAPEGAESIQQLTERLDWLRRENDEQERLAKEEEDEEIKQKAGLIRERDELRTELNEKSKASNNLKKEVSQLERANAAAQSERAKLEKIYEQKLRERQKMKDDMVRWEQETETMREETVRIQEEKQRYLEDSIKERETLRARLAEENAAIRVLEDEVKEQTGEIKKLERAFKNSSPDGSHAEPNLVQQMQQEAEEDRAWLLRRAQLQQHYSSEFGKLEVARRFQHEQATYLEALQEQRRQAGHMMQYGQSPPMQERLPRRENSQRSRHNPSRHSASDSPRLATFPPVSQGSFGESGNMGNPFAAPFFNVKNGMTFNKPTDETTMSDEEKEKLTGGAMMSPGAGAELLPADLFSNDDNRPEQIKPLPGLGALPGLGMMPGNQEYSGPGPTSPGSVSSRSPSVFASPQASQPNLSMGPSDGLMDADRRSIRSTRSNRAPSGGASRFTGMFAIKNRKANLSEDGPPLSKANSMPRQDQGLSGLESAARKRTSSISGTVFQSPIDALDGASNSPAAPAGRKAFSFFNRERPGGWPTSFASFSRRPVSPRPGSTHSNELPRPSVDSSRWGVDGWPSGDATGGARNSPLSFGPGWPLPTSSQSRLYGSRHPSRRPSVQYAGTGPPEDIMEDDDSDALSTDQTSNLAPIGTKPSSILSKRSAAASSIDPSSNTAGGKLNPNAKNFTSFLRESMKFGKASSSSKDPDASTPTNTTPQRTPILGGAAGDLNDEDGSPPNSRKSRDARSLNTTESSLLESGRTSADLARTPSYSNASDTLANSPSLAGSSAKESFMQKISRKSSSGKFALPTFKRGGSSRFEATSAPTQQGLAEEEAGEEGEPLSASVSSLKEASKGSTRSWSSVLKLGKRKGEAKEEEEEETEESGEEDGGH